MRRHATLILGCAFFVLLVVVPALLLDGPLTWGALGGMAAIAVLIAPLWLPEIIDHGRDLRIWFEERDDRRRRRLSQ